MAGYIGSKAVNLSTTGADINGDANIDGDLSFRDNDKIKLGAGSDLQIYHDGAASYVQDTGTGALYLQGDGGVNIRNAAGTENKAVFASDGAVTLYYDNAAKFATTSTGIDVTGTVTADGLTTETSDGIPLTINGGANASFVQFTGGTADDFRFGTVNSKGTLSVTNSTDDRYVLDIANNGDISFYEDTGTTPKFFWDASAESLGIGTSSPQAALNVFGSDGVVLNLANASWKTAQIKPIDEGAAYQGALAFFTHPTAGAPTTPTEAMRIDSSGNVGIGTSSPATALDLNTLSGNSQLRVSNGTYYGYFGIDSAYAGLDYAAPSGGHRFRVGGSFTEAMRIDSSGRVGIGVNPASGYRTLTVDNGNNSTGVVINGQNAGLYIGTSATGGFGYNAAMARAQVAGYHTGGSEVGDLVIGNEYQKSMLFANTSNSSGGLTTRMKIDQFGRVTKPNQTSFEAYLGSDWTLTSNATVPFNSTSYNKGSGYNTSNYRFTAPVAGKYLFYIHTYTSVQNGDIRALHFQFGKNGNSSFRDLTHGGYTNDGGYAYHPPIVGTVIMNLAANDYVYIYFTGGGYSGGNVSLAMNLSYWGGYLLG